MRLGEGNLLPPMPGVAFMLFITINLGSGLKSAIFFFWGGIRLLEGD